MQKLQLIGRLGHGAEVKSVASRTGGADMVVVNFSVAVNVRRGTEEETVWWDCAWWGERARKVAQWLTKGRMVYLDGEPAVRLYEKRDKSTGVAREVRVNDLQLLGGGERAEAPAETPAVASSAAPWTPAAAKADGDVPF